MTDTKILQAILDKVSSVELKMDQGFKELRNLINKTSERVDNIGLHLASLEDDSPTIEEFDKLEKRVSRLENQTSPSL